LLGFSAVSGRGEAFVAGGKVVKNVTGYDLSKLVCGSWGRLAALTEVTLKTLPLGRSQLTLIWPNFGNAKSAVSAMATAMGSPAEVAAAAYLPAKLNDGTAATALRLEGFAPSVAARAEMLRALLGPAQTLESDDAAQFWNDFQTLKPLADAPVLWRINLPPSASPDLLATFEANAASMLDWAGGLIWLAYDGDPARLRTAVTAAGGHAILLRAPAQLRAQVPPLHPRPIGVARLEARVRRSFDPAGVFETGRFLDQFDAD
jgi:glycolate oxidase FAD binding subunit